MRVYACVCVCEYMVMRTQNIDIKKVTVFNRCSRTTCDMLPTNQRTEHDRRAVYTISLSMYTNTRVKHTVFVDDKMII